MQQPLCFLGSRHPLIQAPMAGAQDSAMTVAVCRAGGLGSLPAAMLSVAQLAEQLDRIRAQTDAAFNVNFFAHRLPEITVAQQRRWQTLLQPYFDEYGLDPAAIQSGTLRLPFAEPQLELLQQYRPPVVSFHFGLPEQRLVQAVKDTGALILSTATSVAEAVWLAEHGADAVIAQGSEAGGHRGTFLPSDVATQTGTFALLPQIVDAVKLPVIAAGGIVNHQTIQAAYALGAAAVQAGTVYLLCTESMISPIHRRAIEQAAADSVYAHTALTNVFSGKPARSLENRLMRDWAYMQPEVLPFPHAATAISALRAAAEARGCNDFTPLWCGQNPTACLRQSATTVTTHLMQALAP